MSEMGKGVIPSERSERRESSRITTDARRTCGPGMTSSDVIPGERSRQGVIPSERSERRNLHASQQMPDGPAVLSITGRPQPSWSMTATNLWAKGIQQDDLSAFNQYNKRTAKI